MKGVVKATKRNKCDNCDELAVYKLKDSTSDPYLYLCKSCFKEEKNKK